MKFSDKGIMSVAGTIRGSIAFGLAVSLKIENQFHKSILVSSTLGLVMLTTLIFGAIMPFAIKFLKSFDKNTQNLSENKDLIEVLKDKKTDEVLEHNIKEADSVFKFDHPNSNEPQLTTLEEPLQSRSTMIKRLNMNKWLLMIWSEFDYFYARPTLVHDFPNTIVQHDKLVEKLKDIKHKK